MHSTKLGVAKQCLLGGEPAFQNQAKGWVDSQEQTSESQDASIHFQSLPDKTKGQQE